MKKMRLLISFLVLTLLIAACAGSEELPENDTKMEEMEEKEVAIDYCDLPGGTRVTWFDLSTFIFIPQSSFQMGFDTEEGEFDFEPSHEVDIAPFWMHETEVTNRQYANCVTAGVCAPPEQYPDLPYWFEDVQELDDPIVGVTWEEADTYCQWIGTRLPTEAEWELAARGVNSDLYPWGTDAPDCEYANYLGCLDPDDPQPDFAGLRPLGASSFEMLDMAGNVNEWVSDWYAEDYYQDSPAGNPTGPADGTQRVWRGGDYQSPADELISYLRGALEPDEAQADLGFRCAWSCGEDVPPQLCQLPPAVEVTNPPIGESDSLPKPEIFADGYCEWRNGQQSAGVVLESTNGADLSQYDYSSPDGDITCDPVGDKIVCHGPTIVPGGKVTIVTCPDCDPGYYFDKATGFCKPYLKVDPGAIEELPPESEEVVEEALFPENKDPCPSGYYLTNYCGCIPNGIICEVQQEVGEKTEEQTVEEETIEEEVGEKPPEGSGGGSFPIDSFFDVFVNLLPKPGQVGLAPGFEVFPIFPQFPLPEDEDCVNNGLLRRCPPNTFPITDANGCQVCWPLRTLSDCPDGYYYDEEAGCCIPETPNPLCPWWTIYIEAENICKPIIFPQQSCVETTSKIPECGPRPTLELVCKNPGQYDNQTDCEAANCKWDGLHPLRGDCVMP